MNTRTDIIRTAQAEIDADDFRSQVDLEKRRILSRRERAAERNDGTPTTWPEAFALAAMYGFMAALFAVIVL